MRALSTSRASTVVAVVSATVAVLAVMAFPGISIGVPPTSRSPSHVITNTEPEICGDVDRNGIGTMSTDVVFREASDLLVYFTGEFSGIDPNTELLLGFRVWDAVGLQASTPFEWGFVGNVRGAHSTATVMWSFADVPRDDYDVELSARVDPLPGPGAGDNAAVLENCALTVFVIPVA